jgi:hypothetical protein
VIYVRHYFPGVDLETISDEDFAILSEDALWLHEQMLISRMPIPVSLPEKTP